MSVSLLALLHAVAEKMSAYGPFTTTAAATDSDYLVSSSFVNSNLTGTDLEAGHILIESGALAGEQAQVRGGSGVVKATGVVNLAQDLSGNVGDAIDFGYYGRFPAFRTGTRRGWRELINEALARIPVRDRVSLTATSDLKHYPIDPALYPWWNKPDDVIAVYHPVTTADDVARSYAGQWYWEDDGETRYLVLPGAPWRTGENPTVTVYRPANSRLKINGVWTDQTDETAGLIDLDDETLANVGDVVTVTRAYAYRDLADLKAPGQTVAEWMRKAEQWEAKAVRRLDTRTRDPLSGIPNLQPTRSYARGCR
jgi:hypothetical protein